VLLMIIYTGNRYDSQQDTILIDSLRGRLQEVKYNVLTQSSELMNLTRQSNVEKSLRGTPDSLLHNSITPPFLIRKQNGRSAAEEEAPEEVLVDSQDLAVQEEGVEKEVKEEVKKEVEKEEVKKDTTKTEGQ
jgi:hypothetical protein